MNSSTSRYEGRPADEPWGRHRTNLLWGLPAALGTAVLIRVFQHLMPSAEILPYLLAPATAVAVMLGLRHYLRRRDHRRRRGRS